jgi:hypothetical protein
VSRVRAGGPAQAGGTARSGERRAPILDTYKQLLQPSIHAGSGAIRLPSGPVLDQLIRRTAEAWAITTIRPLRVYTWEGLAHARSTTADA